MKTIFVTGATGYLGRALSADLLASGHTVRALVRSGAEHRAAAGCQVVTGDALDAATFANYVAGCDTLVHLVGVAHPSPAKAAQFRAVDLPSVRAAVAAAVESKVAHFVYVSVAHPAPAMKAYISVRMEGEESVRASSMRATLLRPWYVLGPGHRWPLALKPIYQLLEWWPSTRAAAQRLGLVSLAQMVKALAYAVENPPASVRVIGVPHIRAIDRARMRP